MRAAYAHTSMGCGAAARQQQGCAYWCAGKYQLTMILAVWYGGHKRVVTTGGTTGHGVPNSVDHGVCCLGSRLSSRVNP